jgi:PAS domain S-box-containing protein
MDTTVTDDVSLVQVLEQSPAGVSIITRHRFERLFINPRMIELLGIQGLENTPGIKTFVKETDYHWIMEKMGEGATVDGVEFERRKADTGVIWWSQLYARPTIFGGREAGIIWLFDVTKLKSMESRYRRLAVTQSDWFWETDADLKFVEISDNFFASTGLSRDSLIGVALEDWGRRMGAGPAFHDGMIAGMRARRTLRNLIVDRFIAGERRWIRVSAAPIFEAGVFRGYHGATTDITELHRAQQRLVETERAASLGGLVAGVAHEINTPLGVGITALSVAQSAADDLKASLVEGTLTRQDFDDFIQTLDDGFAMMRSNLNRAAELVRNFKQVAVDQSSDQIREINLLGYIREVIVSLSPQINRTRVTVAVGGDEDVVIRTYAGSVAQIVTNLIDNALSHAFPEQKQGRITIEATRNKDQVTLIFNDDGVGMPSEVLSRIFEPFFTTRRGQGGSGLGMSIVNNLVAHRLAGTVQCTSEIGQGTMVRIEFPARPAVGGGAPDAGAAIT